MSSTELAYLGQDTRNYYLRVLQMIQAKNLRQRTHDYTWRSELSEPKIQRPELTGMMTCHGRGDSNPHCRLAFR